MGRIYIILLLVFLGVEISYAQECDCAYPIVFVHGVGGGEETWMEFSEQLETIWGDKIDVPKYSDGSYSDGTVYYANLNYEYGMFETDYTADVILHDDFANAPGINKSCVYAVSFQVKKDINFTQPVLINANHPLFEDNLTDVPAGDNYSNQSAIRKQGYALGKAIEKILDVTGKEKVILVAHSMGGLASREYLQRRTPQAVSGTPTWWAFPNEAEGHRVAKLLTVGTPHRGSSTGNFDQLFGVLSSTFGIPSNNFPLDLNSEAVRDFRNYYTIDGVFGTPDKAGLYLYGGQEDNIYNFTYHNYDVDCSDSNGNFNPQDDIIIGINNTDNPCSEPYCLAFEGSETSPLLPLPETVKYSYYVSDELQQLEMLLVEEFADYVIGGGGDLINDIATEIVENPNSFVSQYLDQPSDGIVLGSHQWLFSGGNGSRADAMSSNSIPFPQFDSQANYLLSDRISSNSKAVHSNKYLQYLYGLVEDQIKVPLVTQDYEYLFRGIDEADVPFFAYEVFGDHMYSGLAQLRADKVAVSSNFEINGSTSNDPEVDSDWYKLTVEEAINNAELTFIRNHNLPCIIDFFTSVNDEYSNNSTPSLSMELPTDGKNVSALELANLATGSYYLRVTTDLRNAEEANFYKYQFSLGTPEVVTANLKYHPEENQEIPAVKIAYSGHLSKYLLIDNEQDIITYDYYRTNNEDLRSIAYSFDNHFENDEVDDVESDVYHYVRTSKQFLKDNYQIYYTHPIDLKVNYQLKGENGGKSNSNANANFEDNSLKFGCGDLVEKGTLPIASLDIAAHEFFHLVMRDNDLLTLYEGETGALNESMADIFGTYMEYLHDPDNFDWKIGEDFHLNGLGWRSMANPKAYNHPDTYDDGFFSELTDCLQGDGCGVHKNSSIINHWFYLLSEGGKGINDLDNNYQVEKIGIETTFDICMNTLFNLNSDNHTFLGFANAVYAYTQNTYGVCSPISNSVLNAWYAVGIGENAGIMIENTVKGSATCNLSDATATIFVQGGNADYSFLWSSGETGETANQLSTGINTVTITDTQACSVEFEIEIEQKTSFTQKLKTEVSTNCNAPNGSAILIVKDKITKQVPENFLISWNVEENNISTPFNTSEFSVSDLTVGNYSVYFKDLDSGCEEYSYFEIEMQSADIEIFGGGYRPICESYVPDFLTLRPYVEDCNNCQVLEWSTVDGEILNEDDDVIEVPVQNATYELIMIDDFDCQYTASTTIQIDFRDCVECDDGSLSFIDFTGVDPCKEFEINVLAPLDPNEIIAPTGYSDSRWVSNKEVLPYTILFENDPELAEASASRIEITHVFDEDVNPTSFRVGNFNFANLNFVIEEENSFYQTRLDVRDSLGVFVDVVAGVNLNENKAFWIFQAIDPQTGLPPDDPNLGMLPVNDTITRRGEGSVQFKVKPKTTTITLDTIFATAEILFDENEVIVTNTEFNTIDAFAPTTVLDSLPSIIDSDTITISWTGHDDINGCGLKDYTLYASFNSGPLYIVDSEIQDTFYNFIVDVNGIYCFQIKARDWVGNVEEKNSADACVEIGSKIEFNTKLFLEGPFNELDSLMSDQLTRDNLLPLMSPYADPLLYPFTDLEATIDSLVYEEEGDNAIVDWIYVELRDNIYGAIVDGGSYLLQRDGDIVDVNSNQSIRFEEVPEGEYQLIFYHRNHLPIRTSESIAIEPNIVYNVNLTENLELVKGGLNAMRQLNDKYFMISGDLDLNGQIQNKDQLLLLNEIGSSGYSKYDLDLNGQVQMQDLNSYLIPNIGKGKQFD